MIKSIIAIVTIAMSCGWGLSLADEVCSFNPLGRPCTSNLNECGNPTYCSCPPSFIYNTASGKCDKLIALPASSSFQNEPLQLDINGDEVTLNSGKWGHATIPPYTSLVLSGRNDTLKDAKGIFSHGGHNEPFVLETGYSTVAMIIAKQEFVSSGLSVGNTSERTTKMSIRLNGRVACSDADEYKTIGGVTLDDGGDIGVNCLGHSVFRQLYFKARDKHLKTLIIYGSTESDHLAPYVLGLNCNARSIMDCAYLRKNGYDRVVRVGEHAPLLPLVGRADITVINISLAAEDTKGVWVQLLYPLKGD